MWKRYRMVWSLVALMSLPCVGLAQGPLNDASIPSTVQQANTAYIHGMMAWTQMDYPKALKYLGEAVRLQPQNATYREALALVKQHPGRIP